ncbi:MAG TPA: YigZ family protein [Clostridia bacterium]
MNEYLTIGAIAETEIVINKSRFLAKAYPVKDWENASEILKELRKTFWDATHICYGCVADKLANVMRFSDDGEPQGTAGKPILDVIRQKNLRQVLVAVIRYFGGIKLGAGGLVRAYSKAASEVLKIADIVAVKPKTAISFFVSYADLNKIEYLLQNPNVELVSKEWGENVKIELNLISSFLEEFLNNLKNALGIYDSEIFLKEGV